LSKTRSQSKPCFGTPVQRQVAGFCCVAPLISLITLNSYRCFNEISQVSGSIDPKQLAGGIFEALVTTCLGLIVAIPTLYFYAIFKNRVDELSGEASIAAEEIVASFRPESEGQGR